MYKLFVKILPYKQWLQNHENLMEATKLLLLTLIPIANIFILLTIHSRVKHIMNMIAIHFNQKPANEKPIAWSAAVISLHVQMISYAAFVGGVLLPYAILSGYLTDWYSYGWQLLCYGCIWALITIAQAVNWWEQYNFLALWKYAIDHGLDDKVN